MCSVRRMCGTGLIMHDLKQPQASAGLHGTHGAIITFCLPIPVQTQSDSFICSQCDVHPELAALCVV